MRKRLYLTAIVVMLVVLPWAVQGRLSLSIFLFIGLNALIAIGLSLLGGQAGQVSLGQAAFYGIGAYVSAITTLRYGVNPWLGMVFAMGGAALVAYLTGAPILILRGHYLVLGTLGLNIIVDVLFRNLQGLTGGPSGLTGIPPLSVGGLSVTGDLAFYYLTWSAVLGALWLGQNLIFSRVGRALAAVRASEVAAASLGIDAAHYKGRVFALSAALAGLAGSLYVHYLSFVSPSPFAFEFSIALLVMSVVGGIAFLPGAVLGAAILTILREALRTVLPQFFRAGASAEYEIVVFGLLLAAVVIFAPGGVWPVVLRLLGWRPATTSGRANQSRPAAVAGTFSQGASAPPSREPHPVVKTTAEAQSVPILAVHDLTKRFGGLVAVDRVSFEIPAGEIYAIIGPNGAGKTTLFNLISGILRPTEGVIALSGRPIHRIRADAIARLGVARTFQTPQIFPDLTVVQNIMVGMHSQLRAGLLTSMLRLSEPEEAHAAAEALTFLQEVGLENAAEMPAAGLPFGAQRLVEVARALAARPRLILLDEPASGLSASERRGFVGLIRRICEMGVTTLLVEHDVGLVMGLADRVLVLNYGQSIAEGRPSEVRHDTRVISAYLGQTA